MEQDFERRVRKTLEKISQSPEAEHMKKDLQNMARDIQKEFSTYQKNREGTHTQSNEYHYGSNRNFYSENNNNETYRQGASHYSNGSPNKNPYSVGASGKPPEPRPEPNLPVEKKYQTVSVSGTLMTVFGGIGTGVSVWLMILSSAIAALTNLVTVYFYLLVGGLAALTGVFGWMLGKGVSLLKRTSRLKKYLKAIGHGQFCPVDLLVEAVGKEKNYVIKDLQKMIKKRVLPGAHLDDEKTCLMLTDDIYEQYRYVQKQAQEKQAAEEKAKAEKEEKMQEEQDALAKNPELAAAIRQGREMIRQIQEANDRIPGENISEKMFRLEKIVDQIFNEVQKHPEKLPDIRRMMSYYLPTTLKLLDAYEQFDNQAIQGETIKGTKKQIEDSLDTVNLAFENLLDQLFTEKVLDVSSDISVLETMLKQEGLTGSEFQTKKTLEQESEE